MRCAYWLPKAIKTHSKYVLHIYMYIDFPQQQWLRRDAPPCDAISTLPVLVSCVKVPVGTANKQHEV